MNSNPTIPDEAWFQSEINELNALLEQIPAENVIDRRGLQDRLDSARKLLEKLKEDRHH